MQLIAKETNQCTCYHINYLHSYTISVGLSFHFQVHKPEATSDLPTRRAETSVDDMEVFTGLEIADGQRTTDLGIHC